MDSRDLNHVKKTHGTLSLCLLILQWLVMILISCGVLTQNVLDVDQSIMGSVHQFIHPFFDRVAIGLSYLGGLPACVILLALFTSYSVFIKSSWRTELTFLWVSMIGSVVLGWSLKLLINRPRPELWPRLVQDYGASFPSGHSLYAATLATVLIWVCWKTVWRWPCVIVGVVWFVLMGMSRIYLGVHYPTDVVAGWVLGIAWVTAVYRWMCRSI
ncbi:phosphatase PAP2 family protein [Aquirhabdus sp.]|uniref:phosphatase PAP2 family protein n=1 Tax=Aquirhabdus sp. TaxID=2824160 RepID=UPI00396CC5E9